jgi:hypothetical protein
MVVSQRERCRVLACPGCRSAIRVWAEGAEPRPAGAGRFILGIAIVIVAIFIGFR